MIIDVNLREFNRRQQAVKPLYRRHQGTPLSELRAEFGHRHPNMVWPDDMVEEWWEPHGHFYEVCCPLLCQSTCVMGLRVVLWR